MDTKDQQAVFFTAVTTEHFVMQTHVGATLSEAQSRATMFIGVLTGSLIGMGFATRSMEVLLPFIATVLPAVFVMGALTVLRLTDISVESSTAYIAIAKVRRNYRALGPEAAAFFEARLGRWPENKSNPATRLGSFIAYWTSAAAMVAAIDALVGAAAITLLLRLGAGAGLFVSLLAGGGFAAALLIAFFRYQKQRVRELVRLAASEA
jgi:hypothetical protein